MKDVLFYIIIFEICVLLIIVVVLGIKDEANYYYFQGVIRCLEEIKKGNISRL